MASRVAVSHIGCVSKDQLEAVVDVMLHQNTYIKTRVQASYQGGYDSIKEYDLDCSMDAGGSTGVEVEQFLVIKPEALIQEYEEEDLKTRAESSYSGYVQVILVDTGNPQRNRTNYAVRQQPRCRRLIDSKYTNTYCLGNVPVPNDKQLNYIASAMGHY